ncbi:MAG: peptide-methionine (R)-S-oxide reductase [Nanohaloarchaea archaeon SW_7_46_7]|nr:MAG: peptide-methionine (R)-S-oxide reductase [Nanohaloarchaea archaeon SW_7_46_7]
MDKKRRNRLLLGGLTFLLVGLFFSGYITSGLAWMTGTQDLNVQDQRFSSDSPGDERWIQESYQEEIENLSETEYYVTQQLGTEKPFVNELYDNYRPGIYVDVVSGEPLFSSKTKFKSGTGWPSFYRPLEPSNIVEKKDPGLLGNRVEVRSKHADSHLGHIFENPNTPTGLRYCLNSAALEFIPADKLEEEGYGQYTSLFNNSS